MHEPGLLYEVRLGADDPWRKLAVLTPEMTPGSISTRIDGVRNVILFRCCGPYSMVERSAAGADTEIGSVRVVVTRGTELLARLLSGENYEMDVLTDSGMSYTARWTHSTARNSPES